MGSRRKNKGISEPHLTKREFLKICGKGLCALCAAHLFCFPEIVRSQMPQKGLVRTKLSPYFTTLDGGKIQCELCPRRCLVPNGKRGFCRVRENRDGKCYSLVYGNPCVIYLDRIEREPFFHVLPGTSSLTLSTAGCNFRCKFCENWEISQAFPEDVYSQEFGPELVVKKAKQMGAHSIAYTYAEPTIFYEYMSDIAYHAKRNGLLNMIHSNGFINQGPLRDLCKLIDAAHIDLKGFTKASYRELSEGDRRPVLETLKVLKQEKVHLEVSTLIIPTKNDEMSVVRDLSLWVKRELGPDTPVHLSRFYPLYKLQRLPPTPVSTLEKARETALASGLEYVYIGRVPGHEAWNTYCPKCKKITIQRTGYMIKEMHLNAGKCGYCGKPIPGIWA
jgi:pyruvate formate lyase activating enzyme